MNIIKENYSELLKKIYFSKIKLASLPNPLRAKKFIDEYDKKNFDNLKSEGFLNLGLVIDKKECISIGDEINLCIKKNEANYLEKQKIWKIDSLDNYIELIKKILTSKIQRLITNYFQRNFFLADFDLRRVLSASHSEISEMGLSNSDWHKDVRGNQLKLMIYLTDVTSKDSYFSFFPKTHNKKTFNFKQSRFSEDQVNNLEEEKIIGEAGTAVLFDTNLIHRLNRNPNSKSRDTITLNFTPGQFLKKIYHKEKYSIKEDYLRNIITGYNWYDKRINN
tara:strand:- start:3322 stop:4155 length:834 start_codon:yes stop_codon:yes gene_type:complete